MTQGLLGTEVHVGGTDLTDLAYRRLRDAIPNTSRAYNALIKAGESYAYDGTSSYHAALFDFLNEMGCFALTFMIETNVAIDIKFNDNDDSVFRLGAGRSLSLSRWELLVGRIRVKTASSVSPESDANVIIFVSGWFAPTRSVQSGTV